VSSPETAQLLERLRSTAAIRLWGHGLLTEAADEIERLRYPAQGQALEPLAWTQQRVSNYFEDWSWWDSLPEDSKQLTIDDIVKMIRSSPAQQHAPATVEACVKIVADRMVWWCASSDKRIRDGSENNFIIARMRELSVSSTSPPAQQQPLDAILAAVSRVVSSRDDLGHVHFVEIRDAIIDAMSVASTNRDACAGGVNPGWDECQKCGATSDDPCAFASTDRPCTCHPSEAPFPCQKKYAFGQCSASFYGTPSHTEPSTHRHQSAGASVDSLPSGESDPSVMSGSAPAGVSNRPAHYELLPIGVTCRCLHLWQEHNSYWCCKGKPVASHHQTNGE
jgi:hypothetical protein